MTDQEKINQLNQKIEFLLKRQDEFYKEINTLQYEVRRLSTGSPVESKPVNPRVETAQVKSAATIRPTHETPPKIKSKKIQTDLEKFIGENLINKVGIVILVIGVAIGAKYSIDHNLINPLTRIILGYLASAGLMVIGIRLKSSYENYSAVLVSGAIAIMYFMTFAAYDFYSLIPQLAAFTLMWVFTVFGVIAALHYNQVVIAHIGLVGAIAIPFLLSDNSGNVVVLFSYMAVINVGIVILSFYKYWKSLYYAAFLLTWLIFLSWYSAGYETSSHFVTALLFLSIFYIIFYITFLAYKVLKKEQFVQWDIIMLVVNAFLFYAIGYSILEDHDTGKYTLGIFTLANAVVHFFVSQILYRQRQVDKNLFYLVAGLVLVFITIAIPVQLDGNWVTLLWAGEAALLFWIGRSRQISVYEKLSYILMVLAFLSIMHDWVANSSWYYLEYTEVRVLPLWNIKFLTSLLFIGAFIFINYHYRRTSETKPVFSNSSLSSLISMMLPAILIITIYYTFYLEIELYWQQLYADSMILDTSAEYDEQIWNYDILHTMKTWLINYSLFFVSVLSVINMSFFKNPTLGLVNLALNALVVALFLFNGIFILSQLRESYLEGSLAEFYTQGGFMIGIRYISIALVILVLFLSYRYIHQPFIQKNLRVFFDFGLHVTILWMATSELIHWMDIAGVTQSFKLGVTILWGMYSLLLIILGIWKKIKYLRLGAIGLFGITLVKLFFYDIVDLDTIAKTIVFVSLGILLLIISFLYNKYKLLITDEKLV